MINFQNSTSISITLPNNTTWSIPSDHPEGSASWRFRCTQWIPNEIERLQLASILDSFTEILYNTQKNREWIIKELKKESGDITKSRLLKT